METISVIIITYNRLKELRETIENVIQEEKEYKELIIVDNASTDETQKYGRRISRKNNSKTKYFRLEKNLGVAGGRNYAVKKASGDILVFLDDDAVWGQENSLSIIKEKFRTAPEIGILAFKIINYYTKEVRRAEFPFTDKHISKDEERLTSTFIGAGHAIRRKIFVDCGGYPDDFFYGGEELDLSFRVINYNHRILYFPQIAVLHKQAATGRMKNDEKWIMIYRNRMITAYKFLSRRYRMVSNTIWFFKIAVCTKSIRIPNDAICRYKMIREDLERIPLSSDALKYMHENYGRLLY